MTRRFVLSAAAAVLLLATAAAAQVSEPTGRDGLGPRSAAASLPGEDEAAGADHGFKTGPAQSLLASAAYPGLGQILNETDRKAAVIGGVEAFLIARLVLEDRWTRHSFRLYNETGKNVYFEEYSKHFDTRQTLLWWAVVAALYGIADAYVDAHLVGFEDLQPDPMDAWSDVPGAGDATAIRIGLACRF